jgi:hypothetical protein
MDLIELKAKHPTLCAQLVAEGETAERDRVSAHLTMGSASGDMKTAMTAIEDGSAMTALISAKYMAAGMKRQDTVAREEDNVGPLGAEHSTKDDVTADEKASADILAAAREKCGVEADV